LIGLDERRTFGGRRFVLFAPVGGTPLAEVAALASLPAWIEPMPWAITTAACGPSASSRYSQPSLQLITGSRGDPYRGAGRGGGIVLQIHHRVQSMR